MITNGKYQQRRIYARRIYASLQAIAWGLLFMMGSNLQAQQKEISLRAFPSSWYNKYFEPGFDGMGIAFSYHPIVNKLVKLNISAEFSALRARNEFLVGFGINKTFIQAEHFRISLDGNALTGVDLYKPAPLWVGGLEASVRFDYYLRKQLSVFISAGARATICPGYNKYGVGTHSSWPVVLGLRF
jgi:hypothetical protein